MIVAKPEKIEYGSLELEAAQAACPNKCSGHGVCSRSDETSFPPFCACLYLWSGEDCSVASCPNNCSFSGVCNTSTGECMCNAGLGGPDCSVRTRRFMTMECPANCNNNGVCIEGRCQCSENFYGTECQFEKCPGQCSGHGACWEAWSNTFECACSEGWLGLDCSIGALKCPDDCSGHGTCDHTTGKCTCEKAWVADNCGSRECVGGYLNRKGDRFPPPYGMCPSDCQCRGYCVCDDASLCYCACEPGWAGIDCSTPVSQEVPSVLQEPLP